MPQSDRKVPLDEQRVLQLDSFLPYRINLLAHLVSQGIGSTYKDRFGLSAAQWRVLAAVAQYPRITAQRVVELTPMDKVKVSRAVAALSEMGLLSRHASPRDGRVALLELTDQGWNIYSEIEPQARQYAEQLARALTPEQQRQYLELTAKLIESAVQLGDV
jgi:DNA-binding MarR family transcriptional regulator